MARVSLLFAAFALTIFSAGCNGGGGGGGPSGTNDTSMGDSGGTADAGGDTSANDMAVPDMAVPDMTPDMPTPDMVSGDMADMSALDMDAGDNCGNGSIEAPEQCDGGPLNMDTCDPGVSSCSFCSNQCEVVTILAEVVAPPGGPLWNTYVENDGTDIHLSSGTACDVSIDRPYTACVHAGEVRVAAVPGVASCDGITAADALGVFNWRCVEDAGAVQVVSTGLTADKALSDLIDFATLTWLPNSVVVSDANGVVHMTAPTAWHTNPIVDRVDSADIMTANEIHVVRQAGDYEFLINAEGVGLVVQPGVAIGYSADFAFGAVVTLLSNFAWIEGHFAGADLGQGIRFSGSHRSVARNVRATGFAGAGVDLRNVRSPRVEHAMVALNQGWGISLTGVHAGRFQYLRSTRNDGYGIELQGNNSDNVFGFLNISNNNHDQGRPGLGFGINSNIGNVFSSVISAFNDGDGIQAACAWCVFQNITTVGNQDHGLRASGIGATYARVTTTANGRSGIESGGTDATYIDVHGGGNARFGFEAVAADGASFRGEYSTWGNSFWDTGTGNDISCTSGNIRVCPAGCPDYGVSTPGDCCNECYFTGADAAAPPATAVGILEDWTTAQCVMDTRNSDATLAQVDLAYGLGAYVGRTTDAVNPQGDYQWTGPAGGAPASVIADWLSFEHWFRGWGNMGCHTAPDCTTIGACPTTATPCAAGSLYAGINNGCQIFDYGVIKNKADAWLQQGLPTGDSVWTHDWDPGLDAQTCSTTHPGSTFTAGACSATFVNRATEVVGDWIGNENFLCESGERCIWTPYAAAYQGHGPLEPSESSPGVPYVFPDGSVTGVTLLRHEDQSFDVAGGF